jgi:hypothetical protein
MLGIVCGVPPRRVSRYVGTDVTAGLAYGRISRMIRNASVWFFAKKVILRVFLVLVTVVLQVKSQSVKIGEDYVRPLGFVSNRLTGTSCRQLLQS